MDSKYCYANSHVLRNELTITDAHTLFQAELEAITPVEKSVEPVTEKNIRGNRCS